MKTACVQDIYQCDTCKSASDENGRNCRHGMLFPLLLLMGNFKKCMNYEFDAEKVKLQLQRKNKWICLLYTSPSPRDGATSRMPSSA